MLHRGKNYLKYAHLFVLTFCCLALLFSGCDAIGSQGNSSTASSHPTAAKTDAQGIASDAALRSNLKKVARIMQNMTLDDKLAQMIIVEYLRTDYQASGLQQMIEQHVGGFLVQPTGDSNANFDNTTTVESEAAFNAQAQKDAQIPLLIGVDQEGGLVNKLAALFGNAPAAADLTTTGDPQQAYQTGAKYAQELKQTGFNMDFAPVVDVGPPTTLLEDRKFSADPQTVTTYAGAFLDGLQKNGMIGMLKHFPGLGSIPDGDNNDPHYNVIHNTHSLSELTNTDFYPYQQLIQSKNPAMVMVTDEYLDAVDPTTTAMISPKVISLLRQQMNFQGVIVTDGIYMLIRARYVDTVPDATVQAIVAGNDLVEGPTDPDTVAAIISGLKQAMQNGQLSQQRVDESVQRILLMKAQYGIIS